jgi:hypothetical protein
MAQPDLYLSRLKKIEDGQYYDFNWQSENPSGVV